MKNILVFFTLFIVLVFSLYFGFKLLNGDSSQNIKTTNKEKSITLKMAHNLPTNSAMHEASLLFAKRVKEKTNNIVKIDIFPAQKLGNDHQMVEMARVGEIDILLTPTAKMSVPVPSMQYADLPFLFPTREDAYELLDGEPGRMILDDLDSIELYGVTFWENGFKHFTGNEPLLSPEDFKGKKIRVMKSRIIMEQFKALGAEPVPIDFHSTREALKDKVVDGQENPLVAIVNMGFHEVQSDLTLSGHGYLPYVLSISKKTLKKLPIKTGDILIQTAKEITPYQREQTQKREKEFLDTIVKSGVKIHTLTQEQKERFADATKNIIKVYEDVIGSDIISKTEEILDKKYLDKNSVFIGLNADLSMTEKNAGLAIKRGVELAIKEINLDGGLLGKKVYLIAKDHKAISTQGEKNIKELIANKDVIAIIGGKHSAVVSGELKYVQDAKIPFISPWAASSKIIDNGYKNNYMFRVSLNDKFAVKTLVKETLKKYKNPVVVVENSIWGRSAGELIINRFKSKGLKAPQTITINRGSKDLDKIVNRIKKQKADSIIMVINATDGSMFIKSMGKNSCYIPVISHWGITGGDFFESSKKYLKDIDVRFLQTFSFINNDKEVTKKLGANYLKSYGKSSLQDIVAPTGVAQAYDSMKLLALAINNAKSFEGTKIKKALEQIQYYNGALKNYTNPFSMTDHEALDESDIFMARFSDDGYIVPIEE